MRMCVVVWMRAAALRQNIVCVCLSVCETSVDVLVVDDAAAADDDDAAAAADKGV